ERRADFHDAGGAREARDGGDVPDEIEAEVFVERCVDRVEGARHQKRLAVRGRAHDRLGGDIAAGAWAVLNNGRLAGPFRQPLADEPCNNVDVVASGESDDDVHRPRRIGLRRATPPAVRQRSRPDAELVYGGEVSFEPPSRFTSLDRLVGAVASVAKDVSALMIGRLTRSHPYHPARYSAFASSKSLMVFAAS